MKTIIWFLYDGSEVPVGTPTYFNVQSLRYWARKNYLETIQSVHLREGEKPRRTNDTYTICSRLGVIDEPVAIHSRFPKKFTDVADVLHHSRERNDAILLAGADGSDCVRIATLIAKPIFPYRYLWGDAVYFDLEQPGDRESLERSAKSISFSDFANIVSRD